MRTTVLMLLCFPLLFSGCQEQQMGWRKKEMPGAFVHPELKPDVNVKVHRELDRKGKEIRFDSTWRWSLEKPGYEMHREVRVQRYYGKDANETLFDSLPPDALLFRNYFPEFLRVKPDVDSVLLSKQPGRKPVRL